MAISKKDKELIDFVNKLIDIFKNSDVPISRTIIAVGKRDKKLLADEREKCILSDEDLDTVKELRDLMEDVCSGEYTPDSLTVQPINSFIAKQESLRNHN